MTELAGNSTTETNRMPITAAGTAADGSVALLVDHPWPDLEIEQAVFKAAGIRLMAGPQAAGTPKEIEDLVRRVDPDAILTCWAPVTATAIGAPRKLRVVARLGVGVDNISLEAASSRGAWVTNVPDYCVAEVSDHAIAMLLAYFRGVCRLNREVKEHGWVPDVRGLSRIGDLTVGVMGLGRIGRETARKLKAFGCHVVAFDRHNIDDPNVLQVPLARLQRESEVIILHLPLAKDTQHLIDSAFIDACHCRPLLINVSRGGLVENAALLKGLNGGRLRGAALDVVEGEPSPPVEVLRHPLVIVTPHVAFGSDAALKELRERACHEVVRVLRGSPPRNPCNQPLIGTALDGGVSSEVRVVEGPSGPEVIKIALPKLKVAADWFSDPARSNTEVAAIGVFASLIGVDAVPQILWSRPEQHAFAMRLVDPRFRNWKTDLLAGRVDLDTAHRVGELLGRLHLLSGTRPDIRQQFLDTKYFEELRLEPFFLRIAATDPELGPLVRAIAEGMRSRGSALVHGDYSPKNILADGDEVVILDFEVAHWGDPRFDVAFCASHLLLKAMRARGADRKALTTAIDTFFGGYLQAGPAVFDKELVQIMGGLLLARIDGASPVDYLTASDIPKVRDVASAMIRDPEPFVGAPTVTWNLGK